MPAGQACFYIDAFGNGEYGAVFFGLMQTVVASSRLLHRLVTARISDAPQTG